MKKFLIILLISITVLSSQTVGDLYGLDITLTPLMVSNIEYRGMNLENYRIYYAKMKYYNVIEGELHLMETKYLQASKSASTWRYVACGVLVVCSGLFIGKCVF
jgi:hypothetical protein